MFVFLQINYSSYHYLSWKWRMGPYKTSFPLPEGRVTSSNRLQEWLLQGTPGGGDPNMSCHSVVSTKVVSTIKKQNNISPTGGH